MDEDGFFCFVVVLQAKTKMSTLEHLRSFFRLCQFSGFPPFRLELNDKTGEFQQISYSWKYPITWYFIAISITSTTDLVFLANALFNTTEFDHLPLVFKITTKTVAILYIALIVMSRYWFVFKLQTLRNSIELTKKIETYEKQVRAETFKLKNTIKIRFLVGVIITLLGVILYQ